MPFSVRYTRVAEKQLAALPDRDRSAVMRAVDWLAESPFEANSVKALKGRDELRLRVGRFRVFYFVKQAELVVIVVGVADRKEAYR